MIRPELATARLLTLQAEIAHELQKLEQLVTEVGAALQRHRESSPELVARPVSSEAQTGISS